MDQELMLSEEELRKYKIKKTIGNVGIYVFLVIFALFIIIPFYWMFSNFKAAIDMAEVSVFVSFYYNTIIVGFFTTLGTMITTILAAFAFARLNFKGKEVIFSILLATMMIPGEIFVISNYTTVAGWGKFFNDKGYGDLGIYLALIIPFIVSVFYIFFLRQTFRQIPNELYFAAKVDGTGDFKYLWKVMIPMAKSTITSILILSMMGTWNAFVWPNLVATRSDIYLVSTGLMTIYKNVDERSITNLQMAAAILITSPSWWMSFLTIICAGPALWSRWLPNSATVQP